jgi:putative FmdB family regulatory protein
MPLFEYRCRDCGNMVEKIVLGREEDLDCPKCGSKNMDKLISASADYRNEGRTARPRRHGLLRFRSGPGLGLRRSGLMLRAQPLSRPREASGLPRRRL